jgi:hypothetical protein
MALMRSDWLVEFSLVLFMRYEMEQILPKVNIYLLFCNNFYLFYSYFNKLTKGNPSGILQPWFGIPHPKEKLAFLTATKKPGSSSFRRARLTRFNLISLKRIRNQILARFPHLLRGVVCNLLLRKVRYGYKQVHL